MSVQACSANVLANVSWSTKVQRYGPFLSCLGLTQDKINLVSVKRLFFHFEDQKFCSIDFNIIQTKRNFSLVKMENYNEIEQSLPCRIRPLEKYAICARPGPLRECEVVVEITVKIHEKIAKTQFKLNHGHQNKEKLEKIVTQHPEFYNPYKLCERLSGIIHLTIFSPEPVETHSYTGQYSNELRHGIGCLKIAEAVGWIGEFRLGVPHGEGTWIIHRKVISGSFENRPSFSNISLIENSNIPFIDLSELTGPLSWLGNKDILEDDDFQKFFGFADGSYYGEMEDGLPHGQGTFADDTSPFIYKGEFKKGRYNTEKIFEDGSIYQGEFFGLKMDGAGKIITPSYSYVGQFKNNFKHGVGCVKLPNAVTWLGEFKDDRPYGAGTWVIDEKITFGAFQDYFSS
jgi:hypothetical protein